MREALRAEVEAPLREFDLKLGLEARPGEPLALVGPSGAGKTSTLRILAGLLRPSRGRVALGERIWFDSERGFELEAERRRCGYVFQDQALFPRMSTLDNVAYGAPGSRPERRKAALAMLERFGVAGLSEAKPPSLSGGERQRLALARALAARPRALLLDEPLSALDSSTRRHALAELSSVLSELGVPVVLVTHSFEEAAVLAGELVIVDRGAVVQRGDPATISASPASVFVADFAGATVLRGEAEADRASELTVIRLAGGGAARSPEPARGQVAVCVYPWEVSIERADAHPEDSMQNRVPARVGSLTTIGNRTRVRLLLPQPLAAEVSANSARRMGLKEGDRVTAAWKAAATRLVG